MKNTGINEEERVLMASAIRSGGSENKESVKVFGEKH